MGLISIVFVIPRLEIFSCAYVYILDFATALSLALVWHLFLT